MKQLLDAAGMQEVLKLSKGEDQSAVIFEFNPFVASVVLRGIREIKIKMETNYIFVAVVF